MTIPEIAKAAAFVVENLHGTLDTRTTATTVTSGSTTVKQEDVQAMVANLVNQRINQLSSRRNESNPHEPRTGDTTQCLFCYDYGHLMKQCDKRNQYLLEGKIQLNWKGRMELPGGAQLPPGTDRSIKAKIDDFWAAQNVNFFQDVLAYEAEDEEWRHSVDMDDANDHRTPEEIEHAVYLQALEMVSNYEQSNRTGPPQRKRMEGI